MPPDKVCKTIRQFNKEPIPAEDMRKLREIAEDYGKVKRQVYQRYGGIGGLSKIYPGYTVQNEMTKSGLRGKLGLPSVYFYLAVFEALGDIKGQWTRTKSRISQLVNQNEGFTQEEKHYLRFLLKVSNAFIAVLNEEPVRLPQEIQKKHEEMAALVDSEKLRRYLCRQVRKHHVRCGGTESSGESRANIGQDGKFPKAPLQFSVAERAYRYGDNGRDKGIYISTKESRKRIFIPLTDRNEYKCQLRIMLFPEEGNVKISVPVNSAVRFHEDYVNEVGVAMGMLTMLTTQEGRRYGEELGALQTEYAQWIRRQTGTYNRNRADNPGRKKYSAQKNRMEERLHSYINQELNRFLRTEKPRIIYIIKMPKPKAGGVNRKINHSAAMWQRGYIRKRLEQKCREQSVEIAEVLGKDVGNECSGCGAMGSRKAGLFVCEHCGYSAEEKTNAARNVLKRGLEGKLIHDHWSGDLDEFR